MKKAFQIIALVMAIAIVALSLCSCRDLDLAKSNQAFYTDETKEEVLFGDSIYRMIKTGNLDFIKPWNYTYGAESQGRYITEKDVPVLLSSLYGDSYILLHDDILLSSYDKDYIREDQYEHVKSLISEVKLDHYVMSYWNYDDYDYSQNNYLLDDALTSAVNRTLGISLKDKVSYDTLASDVGIIRINPCDQDLFIAYYNKTFYLIEYGSDYYLWDGNSNEDYICPVAEDDVKLFADLFNQYRDSVEYESLSFYFEDDYSYYE